MTIKEVVNAFRNKVDIQLVIITVDMDNLKIDKKETWYGSPKNCPESLNVPFYQFSVEEYKDLLPLSHTLTFIRLKEKESETTTGDKV